MRKSKFFGIFLAVFFGVTVCLFCQNAEAEPKWLKIKWNQPKPWAERLMGVELADEIPQLRNFHFRDAVVDERMVFDYTLRPGPCPTTNALNIMRLEGLPVPTGPGDDHSSTTSA